MGPTGFLETSVRNYHYLLHNNPEERSYLLNRISSVSHEFLVGVLAIVSVPSPMKMLRLVIIKTRQAFSALKFADGQTDTIPASFYVRLYTSFKGTLKYSMGRIVMVSAN